MLAQTHLTIVAFCYILNPMSHQRLAIIAALGLHCLLSIDVNTAPQPGSKPNVILVTIDTLRVDYLGCYGNTRIETPVLDALASDGTLFERAYCQVPMTPPSHASILTGVYPQTHGLRDFTSPGLRAGFPTLAGVLKKSGYSTAAFVSAYVLDSVWGLNQGFDLYYDHFSPREFQGVNPGNVQRKAGETIDQVLLWLNGGVHKPYFLWVHLYDPHHDYNPPEPYHTRYAKDLYGGEVAYADHELGRLFQMLKNRGEYDSSLIVMVSDHGEAFGEHEEYEHGFFIYDVTTHIPLIVKLPRGSGNVVRHVLQTVETVDIAPTILQVVRVAGEGQIPMQGRGFLSEILGKSGPARSASYSETLYPLRNFGWSDLASYSEGKYKFIEAPTPELYDLVADPGEKTNLYGRQGALAESLRQKLRQFRQRQTGTEMAAPASVDSQRIEAMRALGYIAISVPPRKQTGQSGLIDPKDRIRVFNKILFALQASDAGALPRSNSLLSEVVRQDPDLFIAHYCLGVNSLKSGENEKALEYFNKAKALNPSFDLTDRNMATALARLGKVDEAIRILLEVLRQTPSRFDAKKQLAQLYSRQKEFPKAVAIYTEVLADRPQDAQINKLLGIALVDSENYEEGAKILRKAKALGADDAMVNNYLGISLANINRIAEAIVAYRKALELKDDYHQARLNLSFSLLKAGQAEEARKEFDLLCKQNSRLCAQYRKQFPQP